MLSLALAAIGLPGTAHAAVRMCYAPVSSEIVRAQSEREAKTQALAQWRAKATTLGATASPPGGWPRKRP